MTELKSRLTGHDGDDEEGDSDLSELLPISFEWFDPSAHDYHGLKTLLNQLFDVDAQLVDTAGLAELIISQPLLGSTVKVEDEERAAKDNDPLAFLSVLNVSLHKNHASIRKLIQYLAKKVGSVPALRGTELSEILGGTRENNAGEVQIGLLLSERLINVPPEVSPPMYRMLLEEIQWAVEDDEPYKFTHYLVLSKTYVEVDSKSQTADDYYLKEEKEENEGGGGEEEEEEEGEGEGEGEEEEEEEIANMHEPKRKRRWVPTKRKKKKKKKTNKSDGHLKDILFFHPEDEVFTKYSDATGWFHYDREGQTSSDAKRAFQEAGIKPQGAIYLIEGTRFKDAVKDIQSHIGTGSVISGEQEE